MILVANERFYWLLSYKIVCNDLCSGAYSLLQKPISVKKANITFWLLMMLTIVLVSVPRQNIIGWSRDTATNQNWKIFARNLEKQKDLLISRHNGKEGQALCWNISSYRQKLILEVNSTEFPNFLIPWFWIFSRALTKISSKMSG